MAQRPTLKAEIARVLACTPAQRARGIIESPYTRQILEQLPPQEAYLIMKESWGMDSQILLQYVPPETVCRFIDLDCWQRDSFSVDSAMEWLQELSLSSPETFLQAVEALDMEILVLIFQQCFEVVHTRPTDENIQDLIDEGFESIDNVYFYRITGDEDHAQFLKEVLSTLFTQRHDLYVTLLEAIMYELKSSLEEASYEKRTLRLVEMGFPSPEESVEIYRRASIDRLLSLGIHRDKTPLLTRHLHMLPAEYLESFPGGTSLLAKALGRASDATRDRFVYEMVYLSNKILMADYKPLNDSDELRAGMDKAGCLCTLGLKVAMREKGLPAHVILETVNAETLFSIGYNEALQLQHRLKRILDSVERSMIPTRMNGIVEGLLRKRPLYKDREFASPEDIDEVTGVLDTLEAMASVSDTLEWERAIPSLGGTNTGTALDLETVILTAAALNAVTGETGFRPLTKDEFLAFVASATHVRGGKRTVKNRFERDLGVYLASLLLDAERRIRELVTRALCLRIEDELGGILDTRTLDSRFVSCVTVRLEGASSRP
ncbi:MAG TPA: DUF6178 family protein [Deltaproteobacteria bacterium]|nr:DUF6178 family protein [Deltaproteobacteria bacterium]